VTIQFLPLGYGAPPPEVEDYSTDAEKAGKGRVGRKAAVGVAMTASSAVLSVAVGTAAIPAVPWTQIAAAVGVAVAGCLAAGEAIGARNEKILRGDESAIVPFIKSVSRWKSDKRKKVAARLLKEYQNHLQHEKTGLFAKAWRIRKNALAMKMGALYAAESHKRRKPNVALDPKGPTPAQVEAAPDPPSTPPWLWVGGGVAALAIIGAAVARRRSS
jgi:hypothetical protein